VFTSCVANTSNLYSKLHLGWAIARGCSIARGKVVEGRRGNGLKGEYDRQALPNTIQPQSKRWICLMFPGIEAREGAGGALCHVGSHCIGVCWSQKAPS